jgi:hypothetical protein
MTTPTSIAQNTLTIMGVELTVHVLDNGQRIIEGDGVERLLGAMASGEIISETDALELAKIIRP